MPEIYIGHKNCETKIQYRSKYNGFFYLNSFSSAMIWFKIECNLQIFGRLYFKLYNNGQSFKDQGTIESSELVP